MAHFDPKNIYTYIYTGVFFYPTAPTVRMTDLDSLDLLKNL